jgi:hypothetical protein
MKRTWRWLFSSDSALSPFVAIAVMVAGSVSVSSAVNAEDTAFTSSAKDVISEDISSEAVRLLRYNTYALSINNRICTTALLVRFRVITALAFCCKGITIVVV